MKIARNEIATGSLFLVTAAVVVAVVLALGAPGVLHPLDTYYVYFDNAGGVEAGTEVLLAGRRVGQVTKVETPIPLAARPAGHPECEARIAVRIDRDAAVYQRVTVHMQQYGMLGQQIIDFVEGDESSGRARSGDAFVGERIASLTDSAPVLLDMLGPLSQEATATLSEMRQTLTNLNEMTGSGGDLRQTVANAEQFTNTIKKQPWRLVWKSKGHDESKGHEDEKEKEKDKTP